MGGTTTGGNSRCQEVQSAGGREGGRGKEPGHLIPLPSAPMLLLAPLQQGEKEGRHKFKILYMEN